jgi:hypothetical protein
MGYYLQSFAVWLREETAVEGEIDIVEDRAALPERRKQRLQTRWDHLAKQNSFSLPKPQRRSSIVTEKPDALTPAKAEGDAPPRTIRQSSFTVHPRVSGMQLVGDDSTHIPSRQRTQMPAKQRSFTWRSPKFDEDFMKKVDKLSMPRLSKQSPLRTSNSSDNIEFEQHAMSNRNSSSFCTSLNRPHRRPVGSGISSGRSNDVSTVQPNMMMRSTAFTMMPKLPTRTVDREDAPLKQDTPPMPRLTKQRSLPRLPIRTVDSDEEEGKGKSHTPSNMPRLVKQTSFTLRTLSSTIGAFVDEEDKNYNTNDGTHQSLLLSTLDEAAHDDETKSTFDSPPSSLVYSLLSNADNIDENRNKDSSQAVKNKGEGKLPLGTRSPIPPTKQSQMVRGQLGITDGVGADGMHFHRKDVFVL